LATGGATGGGAAGAGTPALGNLLLMRGTPNSLIFWDYVVSADSRLEMEVMVSWEIYERRAWCYDTCRGHTPQAQHVEGTEVHDVPHIP